MPGASHADWNSARLGEGHVGQHRVERSGHDGEVEGQRQHEPEILAEDELRPADRLREERVDAAPLDLLGHEADADEDGDEEPEDGDRRQPEVLDDLHVLARRQLTEKERRRDEQDGKDHEVVGHAVPDRLAEHAHRDAPNRAHAKPPSDAGRAEPASATCLTK